jgi:hypothetical protein
MALLVSDDRDGREIIRFVVVIIGVEELGVAFNSVLEIGPHGRTVRGPIGLAPSESIFRLLAQLGLAIAQGLQRVRRSQLVLRRR